MKIFVSVKLLKRWFRVNFLKQALKDHNWDKRVSLFRSREYNYIPKDVPKGHLAVYVGEECKRFVINIDLLKHPLFQPLLDLVEEVFQFSNGSRFCIPCEERVFARVLQCIGSERGGKFSLCC